MATVQDRPGTQVAALKKVRRLRDLAREAAAALHAVIEVADVDVWGRYELAPGVPLDADDLAGWLDLARAEYPDQPMELLLVVRVDSST